ncbi:MAG: hypothetical protein RBR21_08445 [Bacteroidales bacterium]|nr:hypothetical protein [Bacteroidales bacterium]
MNTVLRISGNILGKREKSSILLYVLVVAILVLLVVGLLLLSSVSYKYWDAKAYKSVQSYNGINSGIDYLLSEKQNQFFDTCIFFSGDTLRIKKERYGAFSLGTVGYGEIVKASFMGSDISEYDSLCCRMIGNSNPVVVCNNTVVKGNFLSANGLITSGTLYGVSYKNDSILYGSSYNMDNVKYENMGSGSITFPYQYRSIKDYDQHNDDIQNSFDSFKINISGTSGGLWYGRSINGRVVIICRDRVIIDDCRIQDAIIYAPEIIVRNCSTLCCQFFAENKIVVETPCDFLYPSALVCRGLNENSGIELAEKSSVNGIILLEDTYNDSFNPILNLENCTIMGEVFWNNIVKIRDCSLHGHLCCKSIVFFDDINTFENHLWNVQVNMIDIPEYYSFISNYGFPQTRIIKWLN